MAIRMSILSLHTDHDAYAQISEICTCVSVCSESDAETFIKVRTYIRIYII